MTQFEKYEAALLGIAHMDVYTRQGEKPAHEVMRDIAKDALAFKPYVGPRCP